jgi:uncharacterized protein
VTDTDVIAERILTRYDTITALWLQLGIASAEARAIAEDAGLLYVEDRCLIIEQRRLHLDAPVPG